MSKRKAPTLAQKKKADQDEGRMMISAADIEDDILEGDEDEDGEVKELPALILRPKFDPISASAAKGGQTEYRRVRCPQHRLTPLRTQWENIVTPIVEYLKLQIRFNTKGRSVELKTSKLTEDPGAAQKGQDFINAFMMGFEIQDAVALLRLDDLYIDSFMVTDVKMLHGDHLSRAIGRIAGQGMQILFFSHINIMH